MTYDEDLDYQKLENEVQFLKYEIGQFLLDDRDLSQLDPLDLLNVLFRNKLDSSYPYVCGAFKIFLTFTGDR